MAGRVKMVRCSFCGKSEDQVRKLISGPAGIYICDECVEICSEIIEEEEENNPYAGKEKGGINLKKPMEIKAFLDEYIIGQEEAKKVLSVAVYNHYKRLLAPEEVDVELQKSNVMVLGPTGSGKTLLAQTLARLLNVPFAIADATTLTEAGYVGEDVENILLKLIQAADFDLERAKKGIIYIDEIDKIVEGTVASVPPQGGRKHPQQEMIQIDTSEILFICGGAFVGMDKIIERRMETKSIGFGAELRKTEKEKNVGEILKNVMPEDFVNFGLIPELIGRIPVVVSLDELDEEALIRILREPKNSLEKQYSALFAMDGVKLTIEDEALHEIAHETVIRKTGARGLRAIVEKAVTEAMYVVPSDETITEVIITKDAIAGKAPATYVHGTRVLAKKETKAKDTARKQTKPAKKTI